MARISTYPLDLNISRDDLLIGTDEQGGNITKNFSVGGIADFIISAGTINTLPVFTSTGLANSLIRQDISGVVYIGPEDNTRFTGDSINSPVLIGTDLYITNINSNSAGIVTLNGNTIIGDQATDTLVVNSVSTFNGNITLTDTSKIIMGVGSDLEIYHDRFKGYIKNITGALNIESNNIEIGTYNNSATGLRSIAIGANTTASNTDAIAMGENTTATGISSTAIGKATNASADGATSMGNGTTASGVNSTSMGVNTLASGSHSTATGNGTVASGTNSISAGSSTTAGGNQSFAVGFSSTANGNVATAMGNSTVASGTSATAMGLYSVASGVAATATGYDTEASGANSTAMGKETTASGENSFATGQGPTASGDNSTALGRSTFSTGTNSFAAGLSSRASGEDSTAMGANSVASGNKSVSIGDRTIANSFSEIAIGSNPVAKTGNATTWIATDRLFSIGNGASASSQSMALEILKNGITVLPAVVSLSFADDTAAATGGVPVGGLYHTSGAIKIRLA
jgi:hypothetical protein|tara:strand:- start:416 stop:1966 length:1551 start_codon:yes stop_codon:yes gene_type:complete